MKNAWEIAKAHPLWIAGSVIGLLVLWYLLAPSKAADEKSAGIYAITQDPNIIAANAAQNISANETNAAVALAGLGSDVSIHGLDAQKATMLAEYAAMASIASTGANAATLVNQQNTDTAYKIAQLNAASTLTSQANENASRFSLATLFSQTELSKLAANNALAVEAMKFDLSSYSLDTAARMAELKGPEWGWSVFASTLRDIYRFQNKEQLLPINEQERATLQTFYRMYGLTYVTPSAPGLLA